MHARQLKRKFQSCVDFIDTSSHRPTQFEGAKSDARRHMNRIALIQLVRVIQGLLGHRSLKTTTLYLHITQSVKQSVQSAVNDLTADL